MKLTSILLMCALACGCDDTHDSGTGGTGGHSGTGGNSGSGGSGGTAGAGGSGGTAGAGGSGGTAGAGGSGGAAGSGGSGGSGTTCGGFAGTGCDSGNYCDYRDNQCGGNDGGGTCQPRPNGCTGVYDPVCACNGQVYPNDCAANAAGYDVNELGGCTPPTNYFACGYRFCMRGLEYCQATVGGAVDSAGSYTCMPLPNVCGQNANCSCMGGVTCGSQCMSPAPDEVLVTCYAP